MNNKEKPNMKCGKCNYSWFTKSQLHMVTCPSCNQKIPNTGRLRLMEKFIQQKRGIVGLETAIILIAFVIIASAFSFMVVNQGLFATDRGKTVIQQGLQQASTPIMVDGTIMIRTAPTGNNVSAIIVPVKAFGVKFVDITRNQTVVMLKAGNKAWPSIYTGPMFTGIANGNSYNSTETLYDPAQKEFDSFIGFQQANQTIDGTPCNIPVNETYNVGYAKAFTTSATIAIANSNGDQALNSGEEGFLIVTLAPNAQVTARSSINIEIKVEGSATLTIEVSVPASLPSNSYVPIA